MTDAQFGYKTTIWNEIPEEDDPFAAKTAYCAGYDVFRDILPKANWAEYLFLLFRLQPPTDDQARLLEKLAIVLANPGMRDHSVLAAMNAGVGGSTSAACLIAGLGVGAGQLNGAREVYLAMQNWQNCQMNMDAWEQSIQHPPTEEITDIWDPIEHFPGFNPNANLCAGVVVDALDYLAQQASSDGAVQWLQRHRRHLEAVTTIPLNFSGVAAACLHELGFDAQQGEMLFLLLRMPGAAVHAIEQSKYGWRKFPFYQGCINLIPPVRSEFKDRVAKILGPVNEE